MIFVGVDDTDLPGTPGTNQLMRQLAHELAPWYVAHLIMRHQLLDDPRVPYTSRNGSASLLLEVNESGLAAPGLNFAALRERLAASIRAFSPPGSDPGLCLAQEVPAEVQEFGVRCQREVVTQGEARDLAARRGLFLAGLGGTEDGVIGALAAVGLAAAGESGRVLFAGRSGCDYYGVQGEFAVAELHALGIDEVVALPAPPRDRPTGGPDEETHGRVLASGRVVVEKRLRPNFRRRRVVLFVEPYGAESPGLFRAVKRL